MACGNNYSFKQNAQHIFQYSEGISMENIKLFNIGWLVAMLIVFSGFQHTVVAGNIHSIEESTRNEQGNPLGMPMLKGDVWQTMSHDSKIAFVWGFGHVVTVEGALMNEYPNLKRESFVTKTIEGMRGIPMNEVVEKIDNYYKLNPKDIDHPVIHVIWKIIIKPNIKTGIAGNPFVQ